MSKDSFASLMESGKSGADDRAKRRLHPGDVLDATVIQAGAEYIYVDVGTPSDGRIPREELCDEGGTPRVGPGDRVRVAVVEARADGPLLKALGQTVKKEAPADEAPRPDEVLRGKVTRIEKFGVFVSTPKGDGLVPIRELGLPPGADHRRMFPPGKEFNVVVIDVNAAGKIRFSATQVARVEEANNFREFAKGDAAQTAEAPKPGFGSLGDVLRSKLGLPEPPPERPSAPAQSSPATLRTGEPPKPKPPEPPPSAPPAKSRRRVR
jgi:ribosomal protein S1